MKILIADDHELFRDGLRLVLSDLGPDLTVIEASSYDQTLEITNQEEGLDLVLLDLVMPGMPWNEGLGAIKRRLPKAPVVILSASEDRRLVLEAVRPGRGRFHPQDQQQ